MNVTDLFDRLPLPGLSRLPALTGATGWLHTEPLGRADLQGKVVVVDFGTYTCINWIRTLPYRRAWARMYGPRGLVVVGVHTPEFSIEHDVDDVRRAVRGFGIEYPIAIDNDYAVWDAFANRYWPALYVADPDGRIRHHHFGEGGYERTEHVIRRLLTDAGIDVPKGVAPVHTEELELAADWHHVRSPETYVGAGRSVGFASPEAGASVAPGEYTVPSPLDANEWALGGSWTLGVEAAELNEPNGRIAYRFHARDLNLILAPAADDAPVRFKVTLDGLAPGDGLGLDVDENGHGVVRAPRLYQLVRQRGPIDDRLFEIVFLDPGVLAYCFTFG